MFVNFEDLDKNARVWIYQANRAFTNNEVEIINEKTADFVLGWQRHGEDLKASFCIKYNQFIVLAVDENFNNVSGCSIDASVNLIKNLENVFSVDLTNKLNVSFRDGDAINIVSMADFQKYVKEQKITTNTIVFNNLVTTKGDFENNWEVTADKSWHKRFLVS
ncbi:ABC transporter ATPase [Lutibacter sp. A80]|uniref:ABC transporter ATPase n=1 Tax=Lutibacter sp. A80 TaxID=2918453 RepID=UPI001F05DF43|nr:ABC transporter ATPase [Lutibacter sp. A80]UMB61670.1 ABC transporter ATPase [Lutibacter sp. A80]